MSNEQGFFGKVLQEELDDRKTAKVSEFAESAGSVTINIAELCRMYAVAYHAGHHDTVEAQYIDVCPADMDTYHEETVREFLDEL